MAVSGTVTAETPDLAAVIEDAWETAGVPAQRVGAEQVRQGRRELWRFLKSLTNKGLTLWTTTKVYRGLRLTTPAITLPTATIDVLNANYLKPTIQSGGTPASSAGGTAANAFDGDFTTACTQTSADGNISYQYASSVTVTHMAVCSNGTATYDLVFESSTDGATWTTVTDAASQSYADDDLVWFEAALPTAGSYFRVRETGGGTLNVRQIYFGTSPTSTPMSRQNRDDYFNLPNRYVTNSDPLQFWLDRQRDAPVMYVWPAPGNRSRAIELYVKRQIYDPGNMDGNIDVPLRWYDAVIYGLAARLAGKQPGQIDQARITYLEAKAAASLNEALNEETDNSSINLLDLSAYTGR